MKQERPSEGRSLVTLRAGVGKSEITTSEEGVLVNDPLYAKTLLIDDGNNQFVIVAMDALAIGGIGDISDHFLTELQIRIQNELAIPGEHVLVNASHTHPQGRLLCSESELVDRTFEAVKMAYRNMHEVRIGSGIGHEDRISVNRNLKLKDGTHWTVRYAHPCPQDEEVVGIGPIDPEIGVLRIDRLDGKPLAVVYNFACHLLIGVPDQGVTANFPGFASKVIEEQLGDGAMALFLQGAGGDILEVFFKDVNRPRNCEPLGTTLGLSTLKAIRNIDTKREINTQLRILSETIQLPVRKDIPERIKSKLQEQAELLAALRTTSLNFKTFLPMYIKYALNPEYPADYSYRYLQEEIIGSNELLTMDVHNRGNLTTYLNNIKTMEKLIRINEDLETLHVHQEFIQRNGSPTVPAKVLGIKIGDCVIITAPAELLVEIGLQLKQLSPCDHTLVAAFSNGYLHYAAPEEHYSKGGYEVTECLLALEWQEIYEQKVAEFFRKFQNEEL